MSRRGILLVTLPWVITAVGLGVYFTHRTREGALPPSVAADSPIISSGAIPSVAALIADPVALQAASKACDEGRGADVMTLCDRVHSAHAQILAQKYRQGGGQ